LESWNCGTFGGYEGLALGGGFDSILKVNFARGTMSARINIVSLITEMCFIFRCVAEKSTMISLLWSLR